MIYRLLADLVLALHFAIVLFVIFGQLFIVIGVIIKWSWIRNFFFRLGHLIAIGIVAGQALIGQTCPLTTWENELRVLGNEAPYPDRFFPYWLHKFLFFDWEPEVFTYMYCSFGALVLLSFIFAPPRLDWRTHKEESADKLD